MLNNPGFVTSYSIFFFFFSHSHYANQFDRSSSSNAKLNEIVGFKPTCSPELESRISTTGIGYMANTNHVSELNVKVATVWPKLVGNASLFLIATKPIKKDEEVFSPYNNTESKLAAIRGFWCRDRDRCTKDGCLACVIDEDEFSDVHRRSPNTAPLIIATSYDPR